MQDNNSNTNSGKSNDRKQGQRNYKKRPYKGNKYNKNNKNRSNQNKKTPQGSDIAVISHTLKTSASDAKKFNPNHKPRRRPQRKHSNDKYMSSEKIFSRYNYLLELHNIARRKYFENSYQTNERILIKLSNNYNQTLKEIKNFVDSLTESQRKALNAKLNLYPEDTSYSETHNLNQDGKKALEDYQIVDPHYLASQKESDFANDTEESVGTLDDYNTFKGL